MRDRFHTILKARPCNYFTVKKNEFVIKRGSDYGTIFGVASHKILFNIPIFLCSSRWKLAIRCMVRGPMVELTVRCRLSDHRVLFAWEGQMVVGRDL